MDHNPAGRISGTERYQSPVGHELYHDSNDASEEKMTPEELRTIWEKEESIAQIRGWDFSHIHGRYEEENALPWDYETIIHELLREDMKLLDYDTGGGEFLLSLHHPYGNTAATEGYPPNVQLCREKLLPLGIDLRECADASHVPFNDNSFDIIINRHGDFDPSEIWRMLKAGGFFITQQVGCENDRELIDAVLPGLEKPFSHNNLKEQQEAFEKAGFDILRAEEAYPPICFFDVGAFVWFAHIIEWEFPGFSVEKCFDRLLQLQKTIETDGKIEGTTHRYLIVAQKPV
jgi:SAM-dependent methyltransferase